MANLNESDLWVEGVYQLEEDDPVLGGPTGIDNRAPRELASRSRYQRLRNVTPWDATLSYPANVAYVSYDGTTWKSVGESLNVAPGTDPAKWVRWGFTLAELNASLGDAVAAHEAKPDPHPQYATDADFAAHLAAANPHAQYATDADLAAHVAAANPHGQYVRHDAAQGLTAAQALQARENIDAPKVSHVAGVVGAVRNLRASLTAASVALVITADEVVVQSALGGSRFCIANFNKTLNVGAVGAGGMDTGAAPASGWVAIYAIANPLTGAYQVIGVNATAAAAPEIYAGANMPAGGYTHSALIGVWPTTAGSLLAIARQIDRDVHYFKSVLSTTAAVNFTALSIAAAVPKNAVRWRGNGALSASVVPAAMSFAVCPTADGQGFPGYVAIQTFSGTAGVVVGGTVPDTPISTPQATFYAYSSPGGSLTLNSYGYTF